MAILISALLAGKSLGNAIKSNGKAIATHSERQHVLAASSIKALEDGNVDHLQALYEQTPANYKAALRLWACEFGRVTFKVKDDKGATVNAFFIVKKKTNNMTGALAVSPAEFMKAGKPAAAKTGDYDYVDVFTKMAERAGKLLETFEEKNVPMPVVAAMESLKAAIEKAEKAAGIVRVNLAKAAAAPTVVVDNTKTAKPATARKAKTAPETVKEGVAA